MSCHNVLTYNICNLAIWRFFSFMLYLKDTGSSRQMGSERALAVELILMTDLPV